MTRMLKVNSLGVALVLAAGSTAAACSAAEAIDRATAFRDTDTLRAAMDVAEGFIDEEGFLKDPITIEAGAGVMLAEVQNPGPSGIDRMNLPRTADGWEAFLDKPTCMMHGLRKGESPRRFAMMDAVESLGSAAGASLRMDATIREHMRLHISEWDAALRESPDEARARYDGMKDVRASDVRTGSFKEMVDAARAPAAGTSAPSPSPVASPAPPALRSSQSEGGSTVEGPAPAPATAPASEPLPVVHHYAG